MFDEYLLNNHKDDLLNILRDEDTEKHFSIAVNFANLFENCAELGNKLLEEPIKTLKRFDKRAIKAQRKLLEDDISCTEKTCVHIRINGLPTCPELHRIIFPTSDDLGSFLQISGTVVRITASKMLEYKRQYRCGKCKHILTVEADYEQRFIFQTPKVCPIGECYGKNIIPIKNLEQGSCKDYQEIKLQEQVSKLGIGTMPSSMWVTLEDDLVDSCKPGDDVTICGTVMRRWKPQYPGNKLDIELVIKANHIEVNNDQRSIMLITPEIKQQFKEFWEKHKDSPLTGRDIILQSICPQLYGLYIVKLAVSVILAGGSSCKSQNTGIKIRSEPHLLLVGDPGTGKSQLLKYASKIIQRSVLTTGIGCTSAGLTVAAVMEDSEWQLEAGALVLSDEGICCIDEFNSMKEHDRASIHEAMEQQTISVAKASMVCKLSTRCSVLAATNPKGHLDPNQSLSLNVAMASPLLSRFDLVLMLRDSLDQKWDELICDYILSGQTSDGDKIDTEIWNIELLQAYFTVIKGLNPTLTTDANSILSSYYQAQRQAPTRNLARTTVRLLDSLVRLSQAHAKLMYRSEVQIMDAVMAVALVESSMQGAALLLPVDIDTLHAPFPKNPMKSYVELMSTILEKLKLYELLNSEINKYKNLNTTNKNNSMNQKTNSNIENEKTNNVDLNVKSDNLSPKKVEKSRYFATSQEPGPSKIEKQNTNVIDTSISQIERKIFKPETNKRKQNFSDKKSVKKSKELDSAALLNLIPSVNDILEDVDLDLSGSFILEENDTVVSSTQKEKNIKAKISDLRSKFEFKPKQTTNVCLKENTTENICVLNTSEIDNDTEVVQKINVVNKDNKVRKSIAQFAFKKVEQNNVKENIDSGSDLSQTCSQLSAKNLFQSQDDDIDLDLDI